jgi:hypothetical protein
LRLRSTHPTRAEGRRSWPRRKELNLALAPADTRNVNVILLLGVLLVVAAFALLAWAFPRV